MSFQNLGTGMNYANANQDSSMIDPATALIIGGVSTLGEGIFSGTQSRKQRKWSESMWNKQNAYNTPKMQMQRLRDAGLNPALMYGKGTMGNAEKPMAYQQASTPSIGANMNASMVAGVQLDLVQSQKKLNEANAFAKTMEGYLKGGGSKETAKNMFEKQMDNLIEDTNVKKEQVANLIQDKVGKVIDNEIKDKTKSAQIKGILQDTLIKVLDRKIKTEDHLHAQWRTELNKLGLNPTDSVFFRALVKAGKELKLDDMWKDSVDYGFPNITLDFKN